MARVYPFKAWRYNPNHVRLDDVVTQPYDKISPSLQQSYYERSPYNLVRIILGLPELFDDEQNNVYTRAARDFRDWLTFLLESRRDRNRRLVEKLRSLGIDDPLPASRLSNTWESVRAGAS